VRAAAHYFAVLLLLLPMAGISCAGPVAEAEAIQLSVIQPVGRGVLQASARMVGDRLVVSGALSLPRSAPMLGHVSLSVYAADGTLLERRRVPLVVVSPRRHGRRPFSASFARTLPRGASIVVSYPAPGYYAESIETMP
jgi:hypothetical protein